LIPFSILRDTKRLLLFQLLVITSKCFSITHYLWCTNLSYHVKINSYSFTKNLNYRSCIIISGQLWHNCHLTVFFFFARYTRPTICLITAKGYCSSNTSWTYKFFFITHYFEIEAFITSCQEKLVIHMVIWYLCSFLQLISYLSYFLFFSFFISLQKKKHIHQYKIFKCLLLGKVSHDWPSFLA